MRAQTLALCFVCVFGVSVARSIVWESSSVSQVPIAIQDVLAEEPTEALMLRPVAIDYVSDRSGYLREDVQTEDAIEVVETAVEVVEAEPEPVEVFAAHYLSGVYYGDATWYGGPLFQGNIMRYSVDKWDVYDENNPYIAASNSFPAYTWLEVTYDGNSIRVQVKDTGLLGPAHGNNIIVDLSRAAMLKLAGILGRFPVQVRVIAE